MKKYIPLLAEKSKAIKIKKGKKTFVSPEPGTLPKAKAKKLAKIYAALRSKKMSKERASKIAWSRVNK